MSDFATAFLKLLSNGGSALGTAQEPWNPAAKLALGVSPALQPRDRRSGLMPMAPNPSQFGSVPGMPTTLQSNPGMNSLSGKGGASG